jgi:hypothetical protein
MTLLAFFVRLTIRLFYNFFIKSINQELKSKIHLIVDIIIYILL